MANGEETADQNEEGVHRLRDIVVEEVSLVDRAANKRRFLVVKRSEKMADDDEAEEKEEPAAEGKKRKASAPKPEVRGRSKANAAKGRHSKSDDEDDDETEKARQAEDDYEEDDDEAKKARQWTDEEEEDEAKKASSSKDEDEAEKASPADDEEGKAAKPPSTKGRKNESPAKPKSTKRRQAATVKADDDDSLVLPDAAKTEVLGALTDALERLTDLATQIKDAEPPDDETDIYVPDELTEELEEIGELLEDVGEELEGVTEKRDVRKAGAKMSKDRLARYQKALELLSGVLKELTESNAQLEPTAGAAETRVGKRARDPEMTKLIEGITELTRVVKGQELELARIRKARGLSNAISVEGGPRRREAEEVSWPLDMNRPISRETTRKSISFYENE